MRTDQLEDRRASLKTVQSRLMAEGEKLADTARDTPEERATKNQQYRELDVRLQPVAEEVQAIEKILDLRANRKPLD